MKEYKKMVSLFSECEPYLEFYRDKDGNMSRRAKEDSPKDIKRKYEEFKQLVQIVEPIR